MANLSWASPHSKNRKEKNQLFRQFIKKILQIIEFSYFRNETTEFFFSSSKCRSSTIWLHDCNTEVTEKEFVYSLSFKQ